MSTEPEKKPDATPRRPPRAKPINDGFVVFEVDGFAHLTPEQRTWPVVTPAQMTGKAPPPARPIPPAPEPPPEPPPQS